MLGRVVAERVKVFHYGGRSYECSVHEVRTPSGGWTRKVFCRRSGKIEELKKLPPLKPLLSFRLPPGELSVLSAYDAIIGHGHYMGRLYGEIFRLMRWNREFRRCMWTDHEYISAYNEYFDATHKIQSEYLRGNPARKLSPSEKRRLEEALRRYETALVHAYNRCRVFGVI